MTTESDTTAVSGSGLRAAVVRAEGEFGATAPQTLPAISELASHLRQRGHIVEADQWMRRALQARTETLGEEHPDTLLSMNNLARLLRVQGRFGETEELLLTVLAARRRAAGNVRAELLVAETNLASLWCSVDDYDANLREVIYKYTAIEAVWSADSPLISVRYNGTDLKECLDAVFAERTSMAKMRANRLRLWFAFFA